MNHGLLRKIGEYRNGYGSVKDFGEELGGIEKEKNEQR
jgi:hypothetical protein